MDVPNERALLTTAFFFLSIHLPMPSIISFEAVTNFWNSFLAPVYNDFANPTALFLASRILLWIAVYISLNNPETRLYNVLTRLTTSSLIRVNHLTSVFLIEITLSLILLYIFKNQSLTRL